MGRKADRIDTSGGEDLSQANPFGSLRGLPAGLPQADPAEKQTGPDRPANRETLHVRRLKAGKGGKVVTEVSGFDANPQVLRDLLKRLQARLGTGGTCKAKILELQGECRERAKAVLEAEGYRVKGI